MRASSQTVRPEREARRPRGPDGAKRFDVVSRALWSACDDAGHDLGGD
jgi:hypothetical protein